MLRLTILAGEDFHPRHLVFMIGPAIGAVIGTVMRPVLVKLGVSKLIASLLVLGLFFGVSVAWTVFVYTTLWPLPAAGE